MVAALGPVGSHSADARAPADFLPIEHVVVATHDRERTPLKRMGFDFLATIHVTVADVRQPVGSETSSAPPFGDADVPRSIPGKSPGPLGGFSR